MMIQLLQFGLLLFAIRKSWCERQLWMLAATVSRLLRRWTFHAVLATQTARAKSAVSRRGGRAQLRVVILTFERKYWRAAKATSTGLTSTLRSRRRQQL